MPVPCLQDSPRTVHNSSPVEIQQIKSPKNPPTTCALDIMQGSRSSLELELTLCRPLEGILGVLGCSDPRSSSVLTTRDYHPIWTSPQMSFEVCLPLCFRLYIREKHFYELCGVLGVHFERPQTLSDRSALWEDARRSFRKRRCMTYVHVQHNS